MVKKQNRFQAPIAEKPESDLLHAIRIGQDDAYQCRKELNARGWSDDYINAYKDNGHAGLVAFIEARHS